MIGCEKVNLTQIRKNKGLSIYRLSKESGVSQPYLKDIESGLKSPTLRTLQKIATALNMTVSQILDDDKGVSNG